MVERDKFPPDLLLYLLVIGIIAFLASQRLVLLPPGYIREAMRGATFEELEDGKWYGELPGFQGVWAQAATREACRAELQIVLEDWVAFRKRMRLPLPSVRDEDLIAA